MHTLPALRFHAGEPGIQPKVGFQRRILVDDDGQGGTKGGEPLPEDFSHVSCFKIAPVFELACLLRRQRKRNISRRDGLIPAFDLRAVQAVIGINGAVGAVQKVVITRECRRAVIVFPGGVLPVRVDALVAHLDSHNWPAGRLVRADHSLANAVQPCAAQAQKLRRKRCRQRPGLHGFAILRQAGAGPVHCFIVCVE